MDKMNLDLAFSWLWEYPSQLPMTGILAENMAHYAPGIDILHKAHSAFWNERNWLPPNMTWADLDQEHIPMAQPRDLIWAFPAFVLVLLLRTVFVRCVSDPLGKHLRLTETCPQPPIPNDIMECAFQQHGKILPDHHIILELAFKTNLSPRQVERWWRKRKLQGKPSALARWNEATWGCCIFASFYALAIYNIWGKPWLLEPRKIWDGFTVQHVTFSVTLLYMLELGFYGSLMVNMFTHRHKDFREAAMHHVATFVLIIVSWCVNSTRIGVIILMIHDSTSTWLNAAKVVKYMRLHKLCDIFFCIFAVQWFFTRFYVFPFIVIRATLVEGPIELKINQNELPMVYYVVNGLLLVLQIYHLIWFRHIFKMLKSLIVKGQVEKDERSDTEVDSSENEDKAKQSVF